MDYENKPFAPFGLIIRQLLIEKPKHENNIFLFCGKNSYLEAKRSFDNGCLALCLPYGKYIRDFSWSVKDLRIIIFDTGGMPDLALSKIAFELLQLEAAMAVIQSELKMVVDVHVLKQKKDLPNVRKQSKYNR